MHYTHSVFSGKIFWYLIFFLEVCVCVCACVHACVCVCPALAHLRLSHITHTKPILTVLSPPLAFVQENWLSFCSQSRWIVALAGSVCCEFYSAIQLPKCAFIASVTPIINYSPRHGAGLAGCHSNGPGCCEERRGYTLLLLSPSVTRSLSGADDWTESPAPHMIFQGLFISLQEFSIFKVTLQRFSWTSFSSLLTFFALWSRHATQHFHNDANF